MTTLAFARVFPVACIGLAVQACAPPAARTQASAARCSEIPSTPAMNAIYTGSITSVSALHKYVPSADHHDLQGAKIELPDHGVDPQALELALVCHAARFDVPVLHVARTAPSDPLRPAGGEAQVEVERETGRIVVKVTSADDAVARRILEKALLLKSSTRTGA